MISVVDCCPTGWTRHKERCYKIVNAIEKYKAFDDAITECNILYPGANLTYIDSASVADFIKNTFLLPEQNSNFILIGLKDMTGADTDSSHIWIQTNKSVTDYRYSDWHSNAPFWESSRCVTYRRLLSHWAWRDVSCTTAYPFICDVGKPMKK